MAATPDRVGGPLALGEGAVKQDELGVCLTQNAQQAGGTGGREIDDLGHAGVRGTD